MKRSAFILTLSAVLMTVGSVQSQTRVSFSKPGYMMRIPTSSGMASPYIFRAGFATDIYSFDAAGSGLKPASAVFIDSQPGNSFSFGFSAMQPGNDTSSVEFGLNFGKTLLTYGDVSVAVGIWDFVITQIDGKSQLKDDYAFYAVISSEKRLGSFALNSYMGVGNGSLSRTNAVNDTLSSPGVFAGFLMQTEIMEKNGGLDLIGEYDGQGLNVGVRIPLTTDYRINVGISQLQYLANFGNADVTDRPGISAGLSMEIPRLSGTSSRPAAPRSLPRVQSDLPGKTAAIPEFSRMDEQQYHSVLDSVIQEADKTIQLLKDSLVVSRSEVENLNNSLTYLRQQKSVLEDSLQSVKLQKHVMEQNINLALKHLSRSLRYFYAGNYQEALNEADMAIQLNPNLSLAYARRGSIYYKMGDLDRAMINWNLALRIDPEYDDVRNILKIISENRLRTTSFMGK